MKFQNLLKNRSQHSNLNYEKDTFTNYKFEEFKSIEECYDGRGYSFYCYTLCRWGITKNYFLIRISDIDIIDNINFIFVCPAYRIHEDEMAKKKVLLEPNKLNLTPGKLSITLDDLPPAPKLDNTNSYYDPKLKRRVPLLDLQIKTKQVTPQTEKKVKVESGQIRNTDELIEGRLHSSHFLSPIICERLWVLGKKNSTGWAWYTRIIEGEKKKFEFYCKPQDDDSNFHTLAYSRFEFPELFKEELSHDRIFKLINSFEEKGIESFNVVIDALLTNITN